MLLLAAHTGHRANIQRQVSNHLTRGQLVHLQDVLHVMDVVHQQMVLVHTRHKSWNTAQRKTGQM